MDLKRTRLLCTIIALITALVLTPLVSLAETAENADSADAVEEVDGAQAPDAADAADDPAAFKITQQPQNVEVSYPDGCSFHVEVSDPEAVESYQWIANDGYSDFILDGVSASTNTLVLPSTAQDDPDLQFRCVITTKDGAVVESEPGIMHIANYEEDKTVLYVGDHAVQPGETLDLATTTYGTGTVAFDEDGCSITLSNVVFDNSVATYDTVISPGIAFMLMRRNSEHQEYRVELVGENVANNTYYDADYNMAGIVFDIYFAVRNGEEGNAPTVVFCGDGSLTLKGGTFSIYGDSNIEVDAALSTEPNGDIYGDSIRGFNILIGRGAQVNLTCNGTALRALSDLRIDEGAIVNIESSAPRVSVGAAAKSIVGVDGSIYMNDARLSIKGFVDPETFLPYNAMLANYNAIAYGGTFEVSSGSVTIEMAAGEGATETGDPFFYSAYGISATSETASLAVSNGAKISVNLDVPDVPFVGGITVPGLLDIGEGCEVKVVATSAGETLGVEGDRQIVVTNATLDSEVHSTGGAPTYGVTCGGIEINLTDGSHRVRSLAENGIALAADTGEHGDFTVDPIPGYTPEKIIITGNAVIHEPASGSVNLVGVPGYGETVRAETIYDADKLEAPSSEIIISVPGSGPSTTAVVAIGIVALAALAAFLYRKRRPSTDFTTE